MQDPRPTRLGRKDYEHSQDGGLYRTKQSYISQAILNGSEQRAALILPSLLRCARTLESTFNCTHITSSFICALTSPTTPV